MSKKIFKKLYRSLPVIRESYQIRTSLQNMTASLQNITASLQSMTASLPNMTASLPNIGDLLKRAESDPSDSLGRFRFARPPSVWRSAEIVTLPGTGVLAKRRGRNYS